MILRPCLDCGKPVAKLYRGYCELHKRTERQRGYGAGQREWRMTLARTLPAYCAYGCGTWLTVDSEWVAAHVTDRDPNSERVVSCVTCNARARGSGGQISAGNSGADTFAPFREKNRDVMRVI